ncbi:MAG: ComEC/Rec2 family competence protein [Cytophagales bacterium]|nr:ComEC family competence protein [Bernardetiaceae bacterium]MDW8211617.1 ComEC/Rec2 family competence protein [Cytophagales bacterium]
MLRSKWETIPFVRVAFLVIVGILCSRLEVLKGGVYAVVFAVAVGGYLYFHQKALKKLNDNAFYETITTLFAYLAFISFGALRYWQSQPRTSLSPYTYDSAVIAYTACIQSKILQKSSGKVAFTAEILQVKTSKDWLPADAKVQIYLHAESVEKELSYGAYLLVVGRPRPIEPPKNPYGFDYQALMHSKGIAYQHFVPSHHWRVIDSGPAFSLHGMALNLQAWSDRTLERFINSSTEAGLASALVVGLKDDLDSSLLRAYSAAGIMHILAVSGLHVGIIFTILSFIFNPLKKYDKSRWIFFAIVLFTLWAYALVSGLSPSVMRAALMFSLIHVAELIGRRQSPFNTLAFSAVVLLAINPLILFQVGFQLSYAAVAGIMYFYPRFYQLWKAPYRWLDAIWSVMCVSIAAQLATFPLGLYYFHQFPNYFLIANLFAIPLSFLMLSTGIVLLAFAWLAPFAYFLGFVLKWIIWLNNFLTFWIEQLPYSFIDEVFINQVQLFCLYAIIIFISAFFVQKSRWTLGLAVGFASLFSASKIWTFQEQQKERLFAVFHIADHSSMFWLTGKGAILLVDSVLLAQPEQIRHAFKGFLLRRGISWEQMQISQIEGQSLIPARTWQAGMLYRKEGLQVFRIAEPFTAKLLPPCDVLIVAHNALASLAELPKERLEQIRCIVLEANNHFRTTQRLLKEASQLNVALHAIALQGALLLPY